MHNGDGGGTGTIATSGLGGNAAGGAVGPLDAASTGGAGGASVGALDGNASSTADLLPLADLRGQPLDLGSGGVIDAPLATGGAGGSTGSDFPTELDGAAAGIGGVIGAGGDLGPGDIIDSGNPVSDDAIDRAGGGGAVDTGGAEIIGSGGATSAGGVVGSGGSVGSGGAAGGTVGTGGRTGSGGTIGVGGVVGAGGTTVGSGGTVAAGGVVGTGGTTVGSGGTVAAGGSGGTVVGSGGSGGAGTGGTVGTGGALAYNCASPVVPANGSGGTSGVVVDFSDPTEWDATTGRWGTAGGVFGRIFHYPDPASASATVTTAVEGSPLGLHFTGSIAKNSYGGGGLTFLVCAQLDSFTQIEFTYVGGAPGCSLGLQIQTFDQRPADQNPPGGCDRSAGGTCFRYPAGPVAGVTTVQTPTTVTTSLSSFTRAISAPWSDQVIGVQWQLTGTGTNNDAGVACAVDFTVTSVRFL